MVATRLRSVVGDFADRRPVAWSELIPSWPEDVSLPVPSSAPPSPVPPPSAGSLPDLGVRRAWRPASDPIDPSAWTDTGGPPGVVSPSPDDEPGPPVSGGGWSLADDVPRSPSPAGLSPSPAGGAGGPRLSAAGAFGGRERVRMFDPGRRGVKALAAVAVVVVVIAAFLAWRSRPRVEPVAEPPVAAADAGGDVQAGDAQSGDDPAAAGPAGPSAEVVVAVEGKVAKPGVVRLPAGSRVADALAAAGGAGAGVDTAMLNLARKVVDGELILVGVTPSPGMAVPGAQPAVPGGGAPGGPVNLNLATLADLDTLPGVGPVLAQRILDARTAQGGFQAVSDLRKVDGIGSSRYEQLKDLVTV